MHVKAGMGNAGVGFHVDQVLDCVLPFSRRPWHGALAVGDNDLVAVEAEALVQNFISSRG